MDNGFVPAYDDPLAGPFWQAARDGELRMSWCNACDRAVWFPRPVCPACEGPLTWEKLCGRATLLSWSVVSKPINPLFAPPFIPALVVPVETPGARLITQLVNCEPDQLHCDMPLQVVFEPLQPLTGEHFIAPLFRPAGEHNESE